MGGIFLIGAVIVVILPIIFYYCLWKVWTQHRHAHGNIPMDCKDCGREFKYNLRECPFCGSDKVFLRYRLEHRWKCQDCRERFQSNVTECPTCGSERVVRIIKWF